MISVVLVDDHKIMRDGIRAILGANGEFKVVGEAATGIEAVRLVRDLNPHTVVMDLNLPGLSGLEATVEILRHSPHTKVVILSMYDDQSSVLEAMRAGARAFVLKSSSHEDLLHALRTVSRGGTYLSQFISERFLHRLLNGEISPAAPADHLNHLTPRERQVMRLVAEGKTSKEIANLLDIGVETVRGYRKTLMKKLGVTNVAELTQFVMKNEPSGRAAWAGSGGPG